MAQRITRSATNREIAGSNPVMDKETFASFDWIILLPIFLLCLKNRADFHGDETKQKLNLDLKNVDVVNCNLANLKSLCK